MSRASYRSPLAGPGMMLLSAAIFGFFGFFYVNWNTPGVHGQVVLFRVLLGWTFKVSSIVFVLSAGLALVKPVIASLVYGLVGLAGAGLFVAVAVMDLADRQHTIMPYAPFILAIFAAWNGYGSWMALRALFAMRSASRAGPVELQDPG